MSMSDPISDMLTRIRNAQVSEKASVSMPASRVKASIAQVLKDEGYIEDFAVRDADGKAVLEIGLKYYAGRPVIEKLERVSRPGLRIYRGRDAIPRVTERPRRGHRFHLFDYRTETDFTPAYYDKTFDVLKLQSVDMIAVYWMGPAIAHTILSFGFEGGDQLAISIETRKEKGEGYSTLKGFFKQYELYYVVADERDVIRVRSNYRKDPPEDVYIYRVQGPIENARRLFLSYMQKISSLKQRPEFYNTLTDNCTTGIWMNTRINPGHLPLSWKILASGYVPQYLHEAGRLVDGHSFAELQRLSHVNHKAQAADQAADFSLRIREGLFYKFFHIKSLPFLKNIQQFVWLPPSQKFSRFCNRSHFLVELNHKYELLT